MKIPGYDVTKSRMRIQMETSSAAIAARKSSPTPLLCNLADSLSGQASED